MIFLVKVVVFLFATVEILPQRARLQRLRARFSDSSVRPVRIALPNAFSFFHIRVEEEKDSLPWAQLAEAAGHFKTRLLLPDGKTPPQGSPLRVFRPKKLPVIALMNGAIETIAAMQLDPTQVRIAVIDETSVLCALVPRLVRYSSALTVVTKRKAPYQRLSEQLMERYGISMLLFEEADARLNESTMLISPRNDLVPLNFTGVVFAAEPLRRMNATILVAAPPVLPARLELLRPPGIDRLQFASALYECCAVEELSSLVTPLRLL